MMLYTRCIFITFNFTSKVQCEVTVSKNLQIGLDFKPAEMLSIVYLFILVSWTLAFHPVTLPSRMSVSHVYRSIQDCDWLNCVQACQDDPHCISYNFIHFTNGLGVCEMIDCGLEDLCDIKSQLVFSHGTLFQQLASPGVR